MNKMKEVVKNILFVILFITIACGVILLVCFVGLEIFTRVHWFFRDFVLPYDHYIGLVGGVIGFVAILLDKSHEDQDNQLFTLVGGFGASYIVIRLVIGLLASPMFMTIAVIISVVMAFIKIMNKIGSVEI